jgi:hypothetical protein
MRERQKFERIHRPTPASSHRDCAAMQIQRIFRGKKACKEPSECVCRTVLMHVKRPTDAYLPRHAGVQESQDAETRAAGRLPHGHPQVSLHALVGPFTRIRWSLGRLDDCLTAISRSLCTHLWASLHATETRLSSVHTDPQMCATRPAGLWPPYGPRRHPD